jgi:hypothetical protein
MRIALAASALMLELLRAGFGQILVRIHQAR